jgi:ABC-2 type transport system permease protein
MISLKRVGLVAKRDFLVTISSKGFLFGVLVMPFIMAALMMAIPKLMNRPGARVNVEVALIDQSRAVADALRRELDPAALAARRAASTRAVTEQLGPAGGKATAAAGLVQPTISFRLRELAAEATVESQTPWLTEDGKQVRERRALVVVPAAAVVRAGGAAFDNYQLYFPKSLPQEAENTLHGAVRQALVAARLRATGIDPQLVLSATRVDSSRKLVSAGGRQQEAGLNRVLPFIMGVLLFIGVMTGGQALMTSTVEEKSSRVVEVLLAAVSPLELMWGKLLGQLGIGMVTLGVYVALGVLALMQFAMSGLIDPLLILYLFLFFLMAYLVYGALLQMIGAAVNQMADAQSLQSPIILLLMLPYVLTLVIGNQPDAPFAVILSFVPPVNAFAMMARLASSSPPPFWQVALSLVASLLAACATVWFASKVFRIGLLMHGKPPNLATLIKWARMS